MSRFTLSFSTKDLAAWLATVFDEGIDRRSFSPMAPVIGGWAADDPKWSIGHPIIDGQFEVRLLDLNYTPAIRAAGGLLKWLQTKCDVFYTSYLVDGFRIIEFRLKSDDSTIVAMVADRRELASKRLVEPYPEPVSEEAAPVEAQPTA